MCGLSVWADDRLFFWGGVVVVECGGCGGSVSWSASQILLYVCV